MRCLLLWISRMISFAGMVSEEQILDLIAYIESLADREVRAP